MFLTLVDQIDMNDLSKYVTYANGVSLVIHPINPFCPTVHANFRTIRIRERETGN
jgi:coproporphyrinogen III oxidase